MNKEPPFRVLQRLGYNGPEQIALLPPLLLDAIGTDLLLACEPETGNDLLAQYIRSSESRESRPVSVLSPRPSTVRWPGSAVQGPDQWCEGSEHAIGRAVAGRPVFPFGVDGGPGLCPPRAEPRCHLSRLSMTSDQAGTMGRRHARHSCQGRQHQADVAQFRATGGGDGCDGSRRRVSAAGAHAAQAVCTP